MRTLREAEAYITQLEQRLAALEGSPKKEWMLINETITDDPDGPHEFTEHEAGHYDSFKEAWEGIYDYVRDPEVKPDHRLTLRGPDFVEYYRARQFMGSYACPLCCVETPHTHSRKEIAEGGFDTRTSTWWEEVYQKQEAAKREVSHERG